MADTDEVLYEVADGVATITLNRPDKLNALTPGMGRRYADLLHRADADPQVRAVVVTGAGRGFCSGADLGVLAQGPDALEGFLADQRLDDLPTTALTLGVPVIGAVNGPCAGIGFVLALCTDVRFAGPGARMSSSFARLGLTAEYGIAWLLPRIVGLPRATEILLSGRTVDAEEALRIGMVHDLVDDPLAAAQAYAATLARECSPASMATIKGQLLAAGDEGLETTVTTSLDLMRASFRWPDLAEALVSRLEKRPVRFPDR
ncbi:MAG: enoyl-CoA hydratase-related protein [Candidatus Nanopelagicales bacterium]